LSQNWGNPSPRLGELRPISIPDLGEGYKPLATATVSKTECEWLSSARSEWVQSSVSDSNQPHRCGETARCARVKSCKWRTVGQWCVQIKDGPAKTDH